VAALLTSRGDEASGRATTHGGLMRQGGETTSRGAEPGDDAWWLRTNGDGGQRH
jgi:hypothetical protein